MIQKIQELLKQTKKISAWTIKEEVSSSMELFFIKEKLDMNRYTDLHEYHVRLFVDFEENGQSYKGDASILIGASDTFDEMKEKIESAVFSAGFVKNNWYDLPTNKDDNYEELKTFETIRDLKDRYEQLHKVLFKVYPYQAKVNSCEVFAVEGSNRIITSKGTDVTYPHSEFSFEIVTDSSFGEEPVEIFNGYYLTNMDLSQVEKIVDRQLMETEGRSKAQRNKKMEGQRIVLSGDAVEEFLMFYLEQATDSSIYRKISKAKQGELFLSESAKEKLNVRINPMLSTSIYARPVDNEGKKLERYDLYRDGKVAHLRTSSRYSHYMGIENIGFCDTFEVEGGERSLEEYLKEDYIEILTFSSFLMDPTTGDFGGEFRLAKQVKNGEVSFITGGAISENIFRVQNEMRFSKELEGRKYSISPKAIIFDNITVSGI